jgi:hypothetical protein
MYTVKKGNPYYDKDHLETTNLANFDVYNFTDNCILAEQ